MLTLSNTLGTIYVTPEYVAELTAQAALSCDGVSDLAGGAAHGLHSIFNSRDALHKGVKVKKDDNGLTAEIHVVIQFGVVISEVVKNIVSKVRFTVEDSIGISVAKVDVYVDGMKNE